MSRSKVWKHYKKLENHECACNYCDVILKNCNTTTSLWNHYNFKHKLENGVDLIQEAGTSVMDIDDTEGMIPIKRKRISRVCASNKNVNDLSVERQELITQALTKMITVDLLAVSFVENKGFLSFMKIAVPGYKVPCRKTLRKQIEALYSDESEKVQSSINKVETGIALTTDGWTSRSLDSYVAITAHYLNSDWNLQSFNLKTEEFSSSHTAENLENFLLDSIEEWNLTGNVSAIVHDNAKNISNAVSNLEVHQINDVACAAHTLQLSIKKGLELPECDKILKKASSLVTAFNHSTKRTNALEQHLEKVGKPVLSLIQSCPTRWNSTFYMIQRLLELRPSLVAVFANRNIFDGRTAQKLEIFEEEWSKLNAIVSVLKPLESATTVLCSESKITLSLVQPIMSSFVNKHLITKLNDSKFIKEFKESIATNLRKRFEINNSPELFTIKPAHIASFLDPRYKNLLFENSEDIRQIIITKVKEMYYSIANEQSTVSLEETPTVMDILLGGDIEETQDEFERYMLESNINYNFDANTWWIEHERAYPILGKLAKKYLAIPATSASSERVFSSAGNIAKPTRSKLKPHLLSALIFLHQNKSHDNPK